MGLFSRLTKAAPKLRQGDQAIRPEPGQQAVADVPIWFERMADIPGLKVNPPIPPPRESLPGCRERPMIVDGGEGASGLVWPGTEGLNRAFVKFGSALAKSDVLATSSSPAARLHFEVEHPPGRSAEQITSDLWLMLERPGEGLDYHFLLQGAVEDLWKIRESDPTARTNLIEIATIDMQLFAAFPEWMLVGPSRPGEYLRSTSLERLAAVHEQLEDLESAFNVTSFAVQYGQLEPRHRRLAKKLGRQLPSP
jgi:hypothetical protein